MDPLYRDLDRRNNPNTTTNRATLSDSMPVFGRAPISNLAKNNTSPNIAKSNETSTPPPTITTSNSTEAFSSTTKTAISNTMGDIVLNIDRPQKKFKKILLSAIFSIIAIVIVVVLIVSESSKQSLVQDVYDTLAQITQDEAQCTTVTSSVVNPTISAALYDTFLTECRNITNDLEKKLANSRSLLNWNNNQTLETLEKQTKEDLVFGEELEKALEVYRVYHQWVVLALNDELLSTAHDIENAAKILTESNIDEFILYGNEWEKARKDLYKVEITDDEDKIQLARIKYQAFLADKKIEINDIAGFIKTDDYSNLAQTIEKLGIKE